MRAVFPVIGGVLLLGLAPLVWAFDHSHAEWGKVLKEYVEDGRVDYEALQKSPHALHSYLREIEELKVGEYEKRSKEEKAAFWVNGYNAMVLQAVMEHYPIRPSGLKAFAYPANSIQQIPGVWDRKRLKIFGGEVSLNDIEHGILRREFAEPRVHFALVCASLGCPVLRQEPYTGSGLHRQLDDQVRDFLVDESKARYDEKTDTLRLSPIFKWYREDFEKAGGILAFLLAKGRHYLPSELEGKVSLKTNISWLGYDWSLNDRRDHR